ncbi:MAG: 4-oxalocrotonate tautomerase [Spirochaetes bacterium]|nr:MAG: 4-oxalocrotonate tautomerase [Spirochaetota bacterium]
MPVINFDLGLGQINEEQKKRVISRFTADAVEITGIAAEKFTVFINESPLENIGVGGKTIKDIKAGR